MILKTTRTERQLLRMQAKNNVIILNEGEDLKKLDDLKNSSLNEILSYQGDSSAFDSEDQKKLLDNMPLDLSEQQLLLLEGFFPIHNKQKLKNLQLSVQLGFLKTTSERHISIKPKNKKQILPCEN